jgi:hypothetical protein
MDSQFEDPEQSYRRGYAHGVWDVLAAVQNRLSAHDSAALEEWYRDEVQEWRLAKMQGLRDGFLTGTAVKSNPALGPCN